MITREQCRAARGLLGLKQTELAEACGVSKTAITNFESGIFNPRADTMAQIFQSFHKMGIEFIGDYGVQKRRNRFEVLDDPDALTTLWDDIFQTLKNKGGEVLISNLSEAAAFNKHPEKLKAHIERLKAHNITERLLVCEGDTFFIQDISCYRWLQKNIYRSGMTFFIYGPKLALQFWDGSFIMIIEHKGIRDEEKKRFEHLWDTAKIPNISDE